MEDFRKNIQEKQAERKLHILKSFTETENTLQKGHMDFDSSNAPKGKSNLTKKTITDKNGHQTTKWVKQGEDVKDEKKPKEETTDSKSEAKSPEDHAKETSTEDLKKYLDTQSRNKDQDDNTKSAIAAAEKELKSRGDEEDEDSNYDTEISDDNISKEVSFAIKQEFGDIGDKTCHVEDLKGILDEYDFEYQGKKISSKDTNKVVKILEKQGWSIEDGEMDNTDQSMEDNKKSPISVTDDGKKVLENQKKSDNDKSGDFSNEDENGEDEDELLDILGDLAFNAQGKFNKEKFKQTYDKLLEIGLTDKFIEKKIGESAWNHPDTTDDEMKTDWDDIIYEMNHSKNLDDKISKVDKSVQDLKKHLTPKKE